MEEANFFDAFLYFILFAGYTANFAISIELATFPDIDRISPVALNWCLTAVFGVSTLLYTIIQVMLLRINHCNGTAEQKNKWNMYDLHYMEFSISLFFISLLEYISESYIAFEDITGYDQAQLLQIYVFSRIAITIVLVVFNFYLYTKRVDGLKTNKKIIPGV